MISELGSVPSSVVLLLLFKAVNSVQRLTLRCSSLCVDVARAVPGMVISKSDPRDPFLVYTHRG